MKLKLLLLTALLAMSANSYAGKRHNHLQPSPDQINTTNTSFTGGSVDIDQRRQFPNGTAIGASSSNTTAPFRYLDSYSTSVLFVAHSKTTMRFDIVSFVSSKPSELAMLAACFEEENYREFREYAGDPCQPR